MKRIFIISLLSFITTFSYAKTGVDYTQSESFKSADQILVETGKESYQDYDARIAELQKNNPSFKTSEEILAEIHSEHPTECASEIFSKALYEHSEEINYDSDEDMVRVWAKSKMSEPDVLEKVLQCPELANAGPETTIVFTPIVYEFKEDGEVVRSITINYSTQKKVLEQKLILARKPSLPNGDANPNLLDPNTGGKYLNTEPAWYAIMVVQHDSLKDFVGPGKNNTLSMSYIDEHIDEIYPIGYHCTSKSAIALDSDTINKVVRKVVALEDDDSNDYYVAGDVDLEWIMYAEIVADIIITIATAGGGAVLSGSLKGMRATKTGIRLSKNMNKLKKFANVEKYINATSQIDNIENYQRILKNLNKARGQKAAKYEKELKNTFEIIKRADPNITEAMLRDPDRAADILKNLNKTVDEVKDVSKELKDKKQLMKEARKAADPLSVKDYDKKLKELGTLRDAQEKGTTISRIKNPEKRAKAMEKYQQQQKRIDELEQILKDYEHSSSLGDYPKYRKEVDNLQSVDDYLKQAEQLNNILKYHNGLNALRRPQTGNMLTRNLKKIIPSIKTFKALRTGARTMSKAGRIARGGMSSRSMRVLEWLTDQTLKHGSRLGRFESKLGQIYGATTVLKIVGDLYDYTSATSKEFTNGITFKPLCLLSADDIEGQDNVVNYGMWLMWTGNAATQADDDAAFLQAMDFASKFYFQLDEYQDTHTPQCNVDIYVVRPIIRLDETNLEDPDGELFYLFMNDIPWTTADQFGAAVSDIKEWERIQLENEATDPDGKYRTEETEEEDDEYWDDDEEAEEEENEENTPSETSYLNDSLLYFA
jgi:hypothetical protein